MMEHHVANFHGVPDGLRAVSPHLGIVGVVPVDGDVDPQRSERAGGDRDALPAAHARLEALAQRRVAAGRRLAAALEDGLELVTRPYAALAARAGLDERAATDQLAEWLAGGVIRRLGVVVRHHELGYRANAMTVWDVPDGVAPEYGCALAASEGVTLAYRRARHLPEWPYNLYCMVHGLDRAPVWERIDTLTRDLGLEAFPRAVLFSGLRFKQTGARVASLVASLGAAHG